MRLPQAPADWRAWLGDLALPVPACHQSWSGFAAAGDLLATTDPVSCRRCAQRAPGEPAPGVPQQGDQSVQETLFGLAP